MAETFQENWLAGPQNTQFYTRTYTPSGEAPPKACITFVHGFAEHIGRYSHFHPLLAQKGVAVFAYDQRGFGLTALDTTGKKSKSSSYGKTCWNDQMGDIDWALRHARSLFPGVPLFLMGHSMGGAQALGFATEASESSHKDALALINGVISTSPLIAQTKPAPAVAKWVGGKVSALTPNLLIPAPVNESDLSHDPAVGAAYVKDPLVKMSGSLKGVSDMLTKGEALSRELYKNIQGLQWLLKISLNSTSRSQATPVSKAFYDAIPAEKKSFETFQGGYHELHNEPGDVPQKLLDFIVAFVEANLSAHAPLAPQRSNL
ncbi:Alpha/Beta hydrolase protein [Coprinopsis sp. MPI-PUGE-AT-0042]|nr:Alpha/Beta hydrolase protein [Coprinopsis sp. MPI-PUGE-AT-0042]